MFADSDEVKNFFKQLTLLAILASEYVKILIKEKQEKQEPQDKKKGK